MNEGSNLIDADSLLLHRVTITNGHSVVLQCLIVDCKTIRRSNLILSAVSSSNRSALIRIPAARGQSTRVELRSPDPACNPYLELAVCLAAGLDGIEKGMVPPAEVTENIFAMDAAARKAHGIDSLPGSLEEAIAALEADQLILDTLGEHVAENYLVGKKKEWDEFRTRVSSWEREKYIINY